VATPVLRTPGTVRASDAERDACSARLRRGYAEGRIDEDELERRLEVCTRARTRSELRRLTLDLPKLPPVEQVTAAVSRADAKLKRAHMTVFVAGNGSLAGAWAALGGGEFWPALVLVPTGAVLWAHVAASRAVRVAVRRRVVRRR
jgi:hypothetical protein